MTEATPVAVSTPFGIGDEVAHKLTGAKGIVLSITGYRLPETLTHVTEVQVGIIDSAGVHVNKVYPAEELALARTQQRIQEEHIAAHVEKKADEAFDETYHQAVRENVEFDRAVEVASQQAAAEEAAKKQAADMEAMAAQVEKDLAALREKHDG
jgi:heat shock protein HspQ